MARKRSNSWCYRNIGIFKKNCKLFLKIKYFNNLLFRNDNTKDTITQIHIN